MPRLQFSLRALLLLMAIVGAAIVVYRWPWTETKKHRSATITTQFRRSWNGKAVKHGCEVVQSADPVQTEETWFEEGELRRQRTTWNGVLQRDESYRDGKLDGPYFGSISALQMRGHFRGGEMHGVFQYRFSGNRNEGEWFEQSWREETLSEVREEEWRAGQRHGRWTWKTPQGQVLQSARFENGRLTHWNGQPVAAELQRWMRANIPDEELQRNLFAAVAGDDEADLALPESLPHGQTRFLVSMPGRPASELIIEGIWVYADKVPLRGRPIGEAILEEALLRSSTLAYRYNMLNTVPISPDHLAWKDRTGVYDIYFEPGSKQEQCWLERGVVDANFAKHTGSRIKGMFYAGNGIQIEVDTRAVDAIAPPYSPPESLIPRTRRDQLGQYLNHYGFCCELRDGKLMIKPQLDPKPPPRN